jgi:Flp pilus assembly pilin Flp
VPLLWLSESCNLSRPANVPQSVGGREIVKYLFQTLWRQEEGQDVAEYSVMLAVILVIIVGTIHLIGGNSNNIFSAVASSIVQ